ncbi:hypothetical protein niasHT_007976 [Heterodera trifolii]|uniref:ShKT domain-containing protein n=1 Tax=Heterodera trifolii TaxID=157864 RepID=A0ABD2M2N2_9BILA
MSTTCASTCGLCATGACADTQDGCIGLRHMCDQKEFEEDMQKCARTCKFCTPKCADLTNDCQIADESSCEPPPPDHLEVNPYYEEMAKVCRKRCHLCDKAMPLNKRIAKKVADRAKRINDGLSDEEMND